MIRGDITKGNAHKMGPQWARKFGAGGGLMSNTSDCNAKWDTCDSHLLSNY
jgi:hypothetical protein